MTNNLNIIMVIYLYKFEVFGSFFVVKKLSDVLNITILDIYIYIYIYYIYIYTGDYIKFH